MGCDLGQGYLFSRPLARADLHALCGMAEAEGQAEDGAKGEADGGADGGARRRA